MSIGNVLDVSENWALSSLQGLNTLTQASQIACALGFAADALARDLFTNVQPLLGALNYVPTTSMLTGAGT